FRASRHIYIYIYKFLHLVRERERVFLFRNNANATPYPSFLYGPTITPQKTKSIAALPFFDVILSVSLPQLLVTRVNVEIWSAKVFLLRNNSNATPYPSPLYGPIITPQKKKSIAALLYFDVILSVSLPQLLVTVPSIHICVLPFTAKSTQKPGQVNSNPSHNLLILEPNYRQLYAIIRWSGRKVEVFADSFLVSFASLDSYSSVLWVES
ncbi:hypothetical protein Pfo_022228, partial [Paulownia fortunei]